jgi:hypothetical protein
MLSNIFSIVLTTYFKKNLGYDVIKGSPFSNGYSDTDFAYMLSYLFFAEHCFVYLSQLFKRWFDNKYGEGKRFCTLTKIRYSLYSIEFIFDIILYTLTFVYFLKI